MEAENKVKRLKAERNDKNFDLIRHLYAEIDGFNPSQHLLQPFVVKRAKRNPRDVLEIHDNWKADISALRQANPTIPEYFLPTMIPQHEILPVRIKSEPDQS